MSYADATTLPYSAVHDIEDGPTSPVRSIPRGKAQMFVPISPCQSIDRPVSTIFSGPRYTNRVHIYDLPPVSRPLCAIGQNIILPYFDQEHKLHSVRTDTFWLGRRQSLEFGNERDGRMGDVSDVALLVRNHTRN